METMSRGAGPQAMVRICAAILIVALVRNPDDILLYLEINAGSASVLSCWL